MLLGARQAARIELDGGEQSMRAGEVGVVGEPASSIASFGADCASAASTPRTA